MFAAVDEGRLRGGEGYYPASHRARLLFAAACCRLAWVWPWIVADDTLRTAAEYLETQFDHPLPDKADDDLWDEVGYLAGDGYAEGTPQYQAAIIVYYSNDPA